MSFVFRRRRIPREAGQHAGYRAEALEARRLLAAATPELIRDVNTTTDMLSPNPVPNERMAVVGGTGYFSAKSSVADGWEPFKTDGTRAGTVPLLDLVPGVTGSDPVQFTNVNGTLFFAAGKSSTGGRELYRSDGTAAGTQRVKDIQPGPTGSSPSNFVVLGTTLYFTADDGTSGVELWKSDGTDAGTVRVGDLAPGPTWSSPRELTPYNGNLMFSAAPDATGVRKLYRLDAAAGTVAQVTGAPADPIKLTVFNGSVHFFVGSGPGNSDSTSRGDLWRTDGTTLGTTRVTEIHFPLLGGGDRTAVGHVTASGSRLYFVAGDANSTSGSTLHTYSPGGGTVRLQSHSSISDTTTLTPIGTSSVLFRRYTPGGGGEAWVSNGTTTGTVMIAPLPDDGLPVIPAMETVRMPDGAVLFTSDRGQGIVSIHKTNGTAAGTTKLADILHTGYYLKPMGVLNGAALFGAYGGAPNQGDLYRSDGTAAGTYRLGATTPGNGTSMDDGNNAVAKTDAFLRVGDSMYFSASDGVTGVELWRTTAGGTDATLVTDVSPGGQSSWPANLTLGGDGSVYFTATTRSLGYDVYRVAPGAATATLLRPFDPARYPAFAGGLTAVGNLLYFWSRGSSSENAFSLWRFDPATGVTTRVQTTGGEILTDVTGFVRVGDAWYFGARPTNLAQTTSSAGSELFRIDGSANAVPQLVRDVNPGSANANVLPLGVIGSTLLFKATDPASGTELWKTDGTEAGTVPVADVNPGGSIDVLDPGLYGRAAATVGGVLYLGIKPVAGSGSFALWRTDGTPAGTRAVPGNLRDPAQFVADDYGRTLFIATADNGERAVYGVDADDTDGFARLTQVGAGDAAFRPSALHAAGGYVYVVGNAGAGSAGDRWELWRMTAVAGSAERLFNLHTKVGSFSSDDYFTSGTQALAHDDSHLYFPMYTPAGGVEPHRLALESPPVLPAWLVPGSSAAWDAGTKTLTVTGPVVISADPGADAPLITAGGPAAVLTIDTPAGGRVNLGGLQLSDNASARVNAAGAARVVVVSSGANLTLDGTATLDLTDNALVIRSADASAASAAHAAVNTLVRNAFHDFAWDLPGITSSTAADDVAAGVPSTLGVLLNNDGAGSPLFYGNGSDAPPFMGTNVDANTVMVRFTRLGDGDLNGAVDTVDFALFQAGYTGTAPYVGFAFGDYDYNGVVDTVDFGLFQAGYPGGAGGFAQDDEDEDPALALVGSALS